MYEFVNNTFKRLGVKNFGYMGKERMKAVTNAAEPENRIERSTCFPRDNPNPVFRFSILEEVFIYTNDPGKVIINFFEKRANSEVKAHWLRLFHNAFKDKKTIQAELFIEDLVFRCYIVPVSESAHVNVYVTDLTAQKKIESEMVASRALVEKTRKAKESFLANISHEIRTPLNAILGMTQLLQKTSLNKRQKGYLNAVEKSTDNVLIVLNDIIEFYRIESDQLRMDQIEFRPLELVDTVVKSMAYKAVEKDVYLDHCMNGSANKVVLGDPICFKQLLVNLVSSAIKFTKKGSIEVNCKVISECPDSMKLCIKVIDTGIDISSDKFDQIFEDFQQVEGNATGPFSGSGLSLAISKRLAEMQGGELFIESEEGRGAVLTFAITFQKSKEKDLRVSPEPKPVRDLSGLRVLLVEDHELNQMMERLILEGSGIQVDTAVNGKIAVEMVWDGNYDLVLMDIEMPVMGGIEATRIIRDELKLKVPIIGFTANALKGEEEKYLAVGMNDYISKPFRLEELQDKIAVLTGWGITILDPPPVREVVEGLQSIQDNRADFTPKQVATAEADSNPEMDQNPVTNERLYDLSYLRANSNGDEGFVLKIVQGFLKHTPEALDKMNQHLENEEWERVGAIAHRIKPSVDFIGLKSLKKIIRLIESYAKEKKNLVEIPALVQKINEVCGRAMQQMREEFDSQSQEA